jgi:hypothetical protein
MAREHTLSEPNDAEQAIMIALDPSAPGYASLELLRHLLDRRDRRLLGLAIEDTELLAHAGSHLAIEVILSGAARPLQLATLDRQLRAQSAAIRQVFEREAARLGLSYAFKVLRGTVTSELAAAAASAEMLVVELPRAATGAESIWSNRLEQIGMAEFPTVLYVREGWSTGNTVLAVIDLPDDIEATVRAAEALTHSGNLSLTVLIGERAWAEEAAVRTALDLAMREGVVRVQQLTSVELASRALAYLARTGNARALVAPARLANSDANFVRELLRHTRCSIMLVNPARTRP